MLYIGIDDTDNLETRGTGFRARELIGKLQEQDLVEGLAVTRHQLLLDPRVPYTSHNSSACLVVQQKQKVTDDQIMDYCRDYLLEHAAEGSDAGLCLANAQQARAVIDFGLRAKVDLLEMQDAIDTAGKQEIKLEGLTGTRQGIIGALSAVGLHIHGNDGRYLWPRDIREHTGQTTSLQVLKLKKGIEKIAFIDGRELNDDQAKISLGEWPRMVRIDNQAVLLVEHDDAQHKYKVLEKDIIKSVRP